MAITANTKLTGLTSLATPASGDQLYIIDVSDTTDDPAGSSRKISYSNLSIPVLPVDLTTQVTGTLPVANGGTGRATLTSATILAGNGTSAVSLFTTTGSGTVVVLATSPTLVTPVLGVATATSINKVAITAPASSATLTIANSKTLTVSNTLTLAGTDSTTMT